MTGTRSRRPPRAAALLGALALAACQPSAPPGVDREQLDDAVSRAVGDPNTCVLIAKAGSGKLLYRYNTPSVCARELPACAGPGMSKPSKLLEATAKDRQPRTLSCNTAADASRGVGWAAGPIEGTDYVYAAVMEGERSFPGLMMADRLKGAFRRAKLSKPAP
jgi:hypothetical protein